MSKHPPATDATPEALVRALVRQGSTAGSHPRGPEGSGPHRGTASGELPESGRGRGELPNSDDRDPGQSRRTPGFRPLPEGTDPVVREFRRWMRENYIGDGKFTRNINTKIKHKELPASFTQLVTSAYGLDE